MSLIHFVLRVSVAAWRACQGSLRRRLCRLYFKHATVAMACLPTLLLHLWFGSHSSPALDYCEIFNSFVFILQILHDHQLFVCHKCSSSAFWSQRHISRSVHNQTGHARASPYFGWCPRTVTPNHSRHTQAHLPSSLRWRRLRLLGSHSYRPWYIFPQVKSRPQVCAGLRLFQKRISFRLFHPPTGTGNLCGMV